MIKSSQLDSWLHDSGSFMERLKTRGLHPQVIVLKQIWQHPSLQEQTCFNIQPHHDIFIREVEIQDKNKPLLFARTLIPASTLTGRERCLAQLGTRSLGSVLFSYPRFERSPFKISQCLLAQYASSELWQRQSLFYLKRKSLLLTEVFLPQLIDFIERDQ